MKEIYHDALQQDSAESLLGESSKSDWTSQDPRSRQVWSYRSKAVTILNAFFFVVSCGMLFVSWRLLHDPIRLMKRISPYSPILDDVPIKLETVKVKGTLFNDYTPSRIWRQPPSEDVDKAWDDMARIEYFGISGDALRKMGKDPKISVSIPEDWGVGPDKYLVEIDMQHQLHCLNAIRKYAHWDYVSRQDQFGVLVSSAGALIEQQYYGNAYKNISMAPKRHQAHLAHCVDIILQALTCNPSLDLISHNWMKTQENPYPDFNIKRQCVAHEPILEWQHRNGISEQILKFKNLPRPNDFPEVEPEPSILLIGEDLGHHE